MSFILLFTSSPIFATLNARQTKGRNWWGYVELVDAVRRITVHDYFLDIEEDLVLQPRNSWQPYDNLNTLEIFGTFNLPSQAVITGVLIWDGDKLLRGKLKSKVTARQEYEDVVGAREVRDPIIIEKISNPYNDFDIYNIAVYPVEWGKSRKIRIRYLCPQKYYGHELMMQIPPSISTEVSFYPSTITQIISAYDNIEKIKLLTLLDTNTYSLPYTLTDKFDINRLKSTYLKIPSGDNSMLVKTNFKEGNWKGDYVMYWGTPPESLLIKSGLRREIVFLWKWNFWNTFVYKDNFSKSISPYGREAINQAKQIYNSNIKITNAGDKVGLLLEKGSPDINKMFPLCVENSRTFDSLQSFLSSIDTTYLLSTISGVAPPIQIRIDEDERENFYTRSTQSFDISLKLICSLFSEHEKIVKHIVFISAGPVPEMPNLEDFYKGSDEILNNKITISAYGSSPRYPTGYWPGVPMYRIVEKHALVSDGEFVNNFWVPLKKKTNYSVTLKNSNNSYTTDLYQIISHGNYRYTDWRYIYTYDTIPVDTMFFSGHTTSKWNDAIEWKAFDENKNILAVYNFIPKICNLPNDTFFVKLWAGTNNPVSDTSFLSNRGARYGIVDENYSLLALEQDVLSQAEKELLECGGLPFLADNEIFISNTDEKSLATRKLSKTVIASPVFEYLGNGSFKIILPGNEQVTRIKIFDLRGRLVIQLQKNITQIGNVVSIVNSCRFSKGFYTIVIDTNVKQYVKCFNIL